MSDETTEDIDRRQSFRLDMEKEMVDIHWVDDQEKSYYKTIACLDFSKGGLKLDCDHAIPINTETTVIFKAAHANSQKLSGRVIRCIEQENGWFEVALRLND